MADKTYDEKLNIGQDMTDAEVEAIYMAALSADTPDLWDRISAGISEGGTPAGEDVTEVLSKEAAPVTDLAAYREKKKMSRAMRGTLAAAAMLLLIGIPAFILGGQRNRTKDETQMSDSAREDLSFDFKAKGSDSATYAAEAGESEAPSYEGEISFSNNAEAVAEDTTEARVEDATEAATEEESVGAAIGKAEKGLNDYVQSEIKTFARYYGTMLYDVTGDGEEDLVTTVTIGSGWESDMVVVYDAANEKGYRLSGRMDNIDYTVDGIEDGRLVIRKLPGVLGNPDIPKAGITGTVVFEDGVLTFVED